MVYAKDDTYYYVLTQKLRGSNITEINENIAHKLGCILANLHTAFRECESQGEFSGYIDFDLSQRNIKIFDLCYVMLGLLSEEEKLEISEKQWFVILEKFFDGYEQQCKLTVEEKQAIPYVMESIEILFAAWFVGQNDITCAKDAIRIYKFIKRRTDRILKCVQ